MNTKIKCSHCAGTGLRDLKPREAAVVESVQKLGRATVRQVAAEFPEKGQGANRWKYTLAPLAEAGILMRERVGTTWVYSVNPGGGVRRRALRHTSIPQESRSERTICIVSPRGSLHLSEKGREAVQKTTGEA
jgi:hypothetical protein